MIAYIIWLENNGAADLLIERFEGAELTPEMQNKKLSELRQQFGFDPETRLMIHECDYDAGAHSCRMARPVRNRIENIGAQPLPPLFDLPESKYQRLPRDVSLMSAALVQLSILKRQLAEIFEFVEPHESCMFVYSHRIRGALLVSCMEFENQCRGILTANGHNLHRGSTNDYVKLCNSMRLQEYVISLPNYPTIGEISPFLGWNSDNPSSSLPWYNAYNLTKHDRDRYFKDANLSHLISSICALAIIIVAQYRVIPSWRDQLGEFFEFNREPSWKIWEHYWSKREGMLEVWSHKDARP